MRYDKVQDSKTMSIYGFSAIELLFALAIMAVLLVLTTTYFNSVTENSKGQLIAQQTLDYSKAVTRYITTHYALLQELLSKNGQSNNQVVTVPLGILKQEGFIRSDFPEMNTLKQIPCISISWNNNRIQSFIYYRNNGDSKNLPRNVLNSGLEHVGNMIGLYKDDFVVGATGDWSLTPAIIAQLFVAKGSADPSQGANPDAYECKGSQIANNSYVINMATILSLNNRLPKDDSLHQYTDNTNQIDNVQNSNTMLSDLNMDYTNPRNQRTKSDIVFQMNPNCVMNPQNPDSMHDYAPTRNLQTGANPAGCRNRQLAIQAVQESNGLNMRVTGFTQAGDPDDPNPAIPHPYVGELRAASIQPTAKVAIGTACDPQTELGKMAQQVIDQNTPVNNLYISQVQCMVNPLCPSGTDACYMPIQTVTVTLSPNVKAYSCPTGMFITSITSNLSQQPDWGRPCCQTALGICLGHAEAHDHKWEGYSLYSGDKVLQANIGEGLVSSETIEQQILDGTQMPTGVSEGIIHYMYTCDAICQCPHDDAMQWQPIVKSITCTNDISKAAVNVPS